MDKATKAKAKLRELLRASGVQAACGITKSGGDYAVKVNLSEPAKCGSLPREIDGIAVIVEVIGPVKVVARH